MKRHFILILALTLVVMAVPVAAPRDVAWAKLTEFDIAWQALDDALISDEIEAPATSLGLTWAGEGPDAAWFRIRIEGTWSGWAQLPIDEDHGPDPGTTEAEHAVPGTDLVWVGPVDAVQFRIEGDDATTKASLIDTTDRTRPITEQFDVPLVTEAAEAATAAPGQPVIRPRSAWDPSGACTPSSPIGPDDIGQMTHAFVHHTTGTNSYTAADVPSRILSICSFHINSRGWNDIAYNFLIDRYGVIWEGRAGGISKGVQGAHTAGFNTYSIGVAFIGDHAGSGPTAAAEAALVDLLAWKFGVHNIDPTKVTTLVSKGSEKWPQGTPVALKPVSGHRDGQATSCPGEACYRRLPTLRTRLDARWDQVPLSSYRNPLVGDFDGDGTAEAAIYRVASGTWRVTETNGSTSNWATFSTRSGWISLLGDFNGDGRDDIANYHSSTGKWMVSRSTGSGFSTTRWATFGTKTGWSFRVGDFNGDGRDDIASYNAATGKWMVARSTGRSFTLKKWATFATKTGWTFRVGDFNGDDRDDIASFHRSSGNWMVSRSDGRSFHTSRWATFATKTGWTSLVGDFNGDDRDDIANHHGGSGNWMVARSTGGAFTVERWASVTTLDHLSHIWAQDVNSDGRTDLLAFDAYNGFIKRHLSNGSAFGVTTLVDTPWRTTLGAQRPRHAAGGSSWVFFGQEFQWVRITGLQAGSASATIAAQAPRP
jgi:N-acetylmuramoyl-L-alanine amidase/FG-GAP-like repeat